MSSGDSQRSESLEPASDRTDDVPRPTSTTVIAWIQLFWFALFLVATASLWLRGRNYEGGYFAGRSEFPYELALMLASFISSVGLLKGEPWARTLTVAIAGIYSAANVLGLILNSDSDPSKHFGIGWLIVLWFFLFNNPKARLYFSRHR